MRSGTHYQTQRRDRLTDRQEQVLRLIAAGRTNVEIAERLGITLDGAKWHVSELISIFGVQTREEAAEIWQNERSLRSRLARGLRAVLLPIIAHKTVAAGVAATAVIVAGSAVAAVRWQGATSTSTQAASRTPTAAGPGQAARMPKNWLASGSNPQGYQMGVDPAVQFGSSPSAFISGPAGATGFGTLMQIFKSDDYRGKRLRLTGMIRSAGVTGWAGLWLRVDGQQSSQLLAFDNMQDRPIVGTTAWTPYSLVLDVDPSSVAVAFGILLTGSGEAWLSNVRLEVVGNDVAVTDRLQIEPLNLDFSQTLPATGALPMPDDWSIAGSDPSGFDIGVDDTVRLNGHPSATVRAKAGVLGGSAVLFQRIKSDHYRGKRVRFSAMVRTSNVSVLAGLSFAVITADNYPLAYDDMQNRPIVGTTDWTRYSEVLDVGASSATILFEVLLSGPGQVWISDVRFEPVGNDVASTSLFSPTERLDPALTPSPSASGPLNLDFAQ
jgi:DNA-binding CsgD family transcriptional regulator